MEYIKIDATTLQATKTVIAEPIVNTYKLDFLKEQELSILKQRNDFVLARDKELVEVRDLIAQCVKLGIKSELDAQKALEVTLK